MNNQPKPTVYFIIIENAKNNQSYFTISCFNNNSFSPTLAIAQGDPSGDPGVPFDGGASLVIAASAAYGVKKYRERKKSRKSES